MKTHTIINKEADLIIEIFAVSKVFQQITVRDRSSNELLCNNLIMHATELLVDESTNTLPETDLQIIQNSIIQELPQYESWEDIFVAPPSHSIILYRKNE